MYDIIIIGAGPAGVSASIYAASRGRHVLLIEKNQVGGLLGNVSTVTHYASVEADESGAAFAAKLKQQLSQYKIDQVKEEVHAVKLIDEVKHVITARQTYEARCVILANGCTPKKLQLKNEERLAGHGIDLNAAHDGIRYQNKNIYVVGGADGAVKEAIYLAKYAKKLTIIHWENKLGCIQEFKDKLSNLNHVEYMMHTRLTAVDGKDEVENLTLQDEHTGEVSLVHDQGCGIFIYAGTMPNTELYSELKLEHGYIPVNEKMETVIPGVYAAGDIRVKQVRQAATAVADGAIAGINAAAY